MPSGHHLGGVVPAVRGSAASYAEEAEVEETTMTTRRNLHRRAANKDAQQARKDARKWGIWEGRREAPVRRPHLSRRTSNAFAQVIGVNKRRRKAT
jgi:hypothetical protein